MLHAFIVFTVGAGFKPAPTPCGKIVLLLKFFKKPNCYKRTNVLPCFKPVSIMSVSANYMNKFS